MLFLKKLRNLRLERALKRQSSARTPESPSAVAATKMGKAGNTSRRRNK